MTRQVKKAPVVTVRLTDLGRANPLDIEDVLPWTDAAELRLLVSEILHHLRVAADHLVPRPVQPFTRSWLTRRLEALEVQMAATS